jgi:hypothetical protein
MLLGCRPFLNHQIKKPFSVINGVSPVRSSEFKFHCVFGPI